MIYVSPPPALSRDKIFFLLLEHSSYVQLAAGGGHYFMTWDFEVDSCVYFDALCTGKGISLKCFLEVRMRCGWWGYTDVWLLIWSTVSSKSPSVFTKNIYEHIPPPPPPPPPPSLPKDSQHSNKHIEKDIPGRKMELTNIFVNRIVHYLAFRNLMQ